MLAWRREWRVDEVRERIVSENLGLADFPFHDVVNRHIPTDWLAIDAEAGGAEGRGAAAAAEAAAEAPPPLVQYRQRNGAWDTVGIVSTVNKGVELTEEQCATHRAHPHPHVHAAHGTCAASSRAHAHWGTVHARTGT